MKRILLATSALAATAGFASAQGGGVTVSGTASMGILGGDWIADHEDHTRSNEGIITSYGDVIDGQGEFELHTDIDVTFTMSGQTDTGLTFGASIDLDESDGEGDQGASAAFDNRKQGGEEIFVSGAFGTLTMGDTDGALDWALQEIGIGESLGDAHTFHLGYVGNDFADGGDDGDGQIARYDYSFGDFSIALSADIAETDGKDILAVGAKYSISFPTMQLGLGVGYQQRNHEGAPFHGPRQIVRDASVVLEDEAIGISLDANFDNGLRAILNWVDKGDTPGSYNPLPDGHPENIFTEVYKGIGIGYVVDDWTFAVNYGQVTEGAPTYQRQDGYGLAVNYDLGGGAEFQFGYSKSRCKPEEGDGTAGGVDEIAKERCYIYGNEADAFSLGVAMSF